MSRKYDNNFNEASDMINCINRGCEIEFEYHNKKYSITHPLNQILICEFYNESSEMLYDNAFELLDYKIDGMLLSDILKDLRILSRSF